jgi:hypothetical protein
MIGIMTTRIHRTACCTKLLLTPQATAKACRASIGVPSTARQHHDFHTSETSRLAVTARGQSTGTRLMYLYLHFGELSGIRPTPIS